MNLIAMYRTETDWCALVEQAARRNAVSDTKFGTRRLTLTYAALAGRAKLVSPTSLAQEAALAGETEFRT